MLALVGSGRSYSAVAEEVFGQARFRGRVERIVRRDREQGGVTVPSLESLLSQLPPEPDEEGGETDPRSLLEQLVPLYGAILKRRLEADLPVNGRELKALADLEFRLESKRQVERLNAMTRGMA